jgi:hypothetical protein
MSPVSSDYAGASLYIDAETVDDFQKQLKHISEYGKNRFLSGFSPSRTTNI